MNTLPNVVWAGPGLWFVASAMVDGAYYPVRMADDALTCSCPRARAQSVRPLDERRACRHMKAVAAFEREDVA